MCGIVYGQSLNNKPINEIIATAYQAQRGRGIDGWGFTELYDKKIISARFVDEKDFLKRLEKSESPEILMHHRAPTSTLNNIKTNHPIVSLDCYDYNYYFVHNGVIRNAEELKKEHEKEFNSRYTTEDGKPDYFNDSEALMHELILIIEGKKEAKDFDVKGSLAFIMMQADKFNKPIALYYGRNSNPLTRTVSDDHIILTSVGGKEDIGVNRLFKFDYDTKETTDEFIDLGGFEHGKSKGNITTYPAINHTGDSTKQTVIELPNSTGYGGGRQIDWRGGATRTWNGEKKQSETYRQIGVNGIMNFCRVAYNSLQQLSNQELSMLLYMGRNILNNQHIDLEKAIFREDSNEAIKIDAQIGILNDNLYTIEQLLNK